MTSLGIHHLDGHQCPPDARDQEDCDFLSQMGEFREEDGYYEREDAAFWVPHQKRLTEMVKFDGFTATIDDIITECGYREADREWLTAVHRRSMESFLKSYRGTVNGRIPLLDEAQISKGWSD